MTTLASNLKHVAAHAHSRRCGRPGDLEDLARAARCLLRAADLIDQAQAMTAIALECISQTTARPDAQPPGTAAPSPNGDTAGWLILLASPLADGTTEHTLLGAAPNPRLAFADARRRCETVNCTLPDNAHAAPADPNAITTALALLERPGAVQRLAREPVIAGAHTTFLRGAPCRDCDGLDLPDCPRCSGSEFEIAEIDPDPENDVALVVGPRWAPRPTDTHHHAHGRPVYPPCPDCGGDIERSDHLGHLTTNCAHCGAPFFLAEPDLS